MLQNRSIFPLYRQDKGPVHPLLIIHNTNDDTVSYRYSEYFAGMLDRGGATVQLKLYSYGAHNAWDNGPKGQITGWDGTMYDLSESRRMAIEFFRQYEP